MVGGVTYTDIWSREAGSSPARYDTDFLAWQFQPAPMSPALGAVSPITAGGASTVYCSDQGAGLDYAWTVTSLTHGLQGTVGTGRTATFTPGTDQVTAWPATATLQGSAQVQNQAVPLFNPAPVRVQVLPPPYVGISTRTLPYGGGIVDFTITGAYAVIKGGPVSQQVALPQGSASGSYSFVAPVDLSRLPAGTTPIAVIVSNGAADAGAVRTFTFAGTGPVGWSIGPGAALQKATGTTVQVTIPRATLATGSSAALQSSSRSTAHRATGRLNPLPSSR